MSVHSTSYLVWMQGVPKCKPSTKLKQILYRIKPANEKWFFRQIKYQTSTIIIIIILH